MDDRTKELNEPIRTVIEEQIAKATHTVSGSEPTTPKAGDTWDDALGNVKMFCANASSPWTLMFTYDAV